MHHSRALSRMRAFLILLCAGRVLKACESVRLWPFWHSALAGALSMRRMVSLATPASSAPPIATLPVKGGVEAGMWESTALKAVRHLGQRLGEWWGLPLGAVLTPVAFVVRLAG
eukprot:1857669-Pleurochrysis_carterae.AAC.2